MEYLKENLDLVKENIEKACKKINKNPREITLVAVTKTISEDVINESTKYGVTDIGENKVQEITRKYDQINEDIKWHLIGHLQTNKVKYIIDKVDLIHSVDSFKLAKEIDKRAKSINKTMEVLLQLNISLEESKFGVNEDEILNLVKDISKLENVKVMGLMTMAPYYQDPEDTRIIFKKLKEIFEQLKYNKYNNVKMKYLSMGMTSDYIVAIEEGANIIRVGTGIFGKREELCQIKF